MNLAPIILFVYKRPLHTLQTLVSLQHNHLSKQSLLYIFADAPKEDATEDELKAIAEVKKIIWTQQWCREIRLIERKQNFGLVKNIVDGVTNVVQQHGKVIVLEDDIVTSPGFLTYMNQALNLYASNPVVMQVSGHLPPVILNKKNPDTFFFKKTACWGWGTWAHAWAKLNLDPQYLLNEINSLDKVSAFNIDDSYNFIEHLEANIEGRMNTWAIRWQASVFLEDGLCLYPKKSLTRNIGFDGSGEHCTYSKLYLTQPMATSVEVVKVELTESDEARKKIATFNNQQWQSISFIQKVKSRLKRWIK
ncbi:glycosyltransferase [Microscilla marina]|uniref:Sugar transferase n=1 Tax=Microscilla marina ATCC 23134 TaxID=313606 RepID=A1ZCK8_MICM2|nr:glycosyltransferase [Microscilla marina]EAY32010.1 sugar transferase [Microscilla marina ATCC 23134]